MEGNNATSVHGNDSNTLIINSEIDKMYKDVQRINI